LSGKKEKEEDGTTPALSTLFVSFFSSNAATITMGAGASAQSVYGDALLWFKRYFDTETYVEDFKAIDKDNDGGITDDELMRWINIKKQREGGSWGSMVENKEVFKIAHLQTVGATGGDGVATTAKGLKSFTIVAFRTYLLHLYSSASCGRTSSAPTIPTSAATRGI
jgi:hypothetical protein